jgi:hypothetical protein
MNSYPLISIFYKNTNLTKKYLHLFVLDHLDAILSFSFFKFLIQKYFYYYSKRIPCKEYI